MSTLNLNLNHSTVNLDSKELKENIEKIKNTPVPNFAKYTPALKEIRKLKEKYKNIKNIIVEGNGGSISNFRGIFQALGDKENKNIFILDTEDPDYIKYLKNKCPKEDTLVILTSKSGARIQVLANYSAEIIKGGKEMYALCDINSPLERGERCVNIKNNPALQLALTLDKLEEVGYIEIFLSVYSKKLSGFFELIKQLFHESVCKNELGQTIYGGEAPENQHHTLQRFISGRKNSVGLFITVKDFSDYRTKPKTELGSGYPEPSSVLKVSNNLKNIKCRNITLGDLNNISLDKIIKTEFQGTWQDVIDNNIPAIHLELDEISPRAIGEFMAFFQYTAFYSALLRGVNPCDQPGVEKSKENIFGIVREIN